MQFLSVCPAFIAGGLCHRQATFPRVVGVHWLLSGFDHREALAKGTEGEGIRKKLSLCPAVSPAVACLAIPSPTLKVPHQSSSRAPGTPFPLLSLWLRVIWRPALASFWAPYLPVWLLSSSMFCITNSRSEILSLEYSNGLFPG